MLDDLYERTYFDNSPDNCPDSMDNTNDGYFKKFMRDIKEPLYPNCKKFLKFEY